MNCPACLEELPYINEANNSNNNPIVTIVIGSSIETVKQFMADNGYTFSVLADTSGAVAASYGVRFTPTTFLIDSRGLINSMYQSQNSPQKNV